jgi:hypothetical protein
MRYAQSMPAPSKTYEGHPDFHAASEAQKRVDTLHALLLEARDVRDHEVANLLGRYRVVEIAKTIGCMEGTVRQARDKVERRDEARRLHASGKDIGDIASEMGLSFRTVHDLLSGL